MGAAFAKRDIQEGIKLYQRHEYSEAILVWRRSLHKIRDRASRFVTLDYLSSAHGELGQYRDMLAYAVMQIEIANRADDSSLRVQAYVNLAVSSERLCEYHKAISYCRQCLQHKPPDTRTYGLVYLIQGLAYFGLSNFSKSFEMIQYAARLSRKCDDPELTIQTYSALGQVFLALKDYEKSLRFHLRAFEAAKELAETQPGAKHERITSLDLGVSYAKINEFSESRHNLEEALRAALHTGDKVTQGRCYCAKANLYRRQKDLQHAEHFYESAASVLVTLGDKMGQIEVFRGMAKNVNHGSHASVERNVKALDYYKKSLDLATSIGNKFLMLKFNREIRQLYRCLGDHVLEDVHAKRCDHLSDDLDLHCWMCGLDVGELPDTVEIFSCFHVAHERCVRLMPRDNSDSPYHSGKCKRCHNKDPSSPEKGGGPEQSNATGAIGGSSGSLRLGESPRKSSRGDYRRESYESGHSRHEYQSKPSRTPSPSNSRPELSVSPARTSSSTYITRDRSHSPIPNASSPNHHHQGDDYNHHLSGISTSPNLQHDYLPQCAINRQHSSPNEFQRSRTPSPVMSQNQLMVSPRYAGAKNRRKSAPFSQQQHVMFQDSESSQANQLPRRTYQPEGRLAPQSSGRRPSCPDSQYHAVRRISHTDGTRVKRRADGRRPSHIPTSQERLQAVANARKYSLGSNSFETLKHVPRYNVQGWPDD